MACWEGKAWKFWGAWETLVNQLYSSLKMEMTDKPRSTLSQFAETLDMTTSGGLLLYENDSINHSHSVSLYVYTFIYTCIFITLYPLILYI